MSTSDSLESRIKSVLDELSPTQSRLARFILENKYYVSYASANQVAEKVDTSASTVVRFAQTVGYDGFSDLQASVQEEFPDNLTTVERVQERLVGSPSYDDIHHRVFRTDINNIERTANKLSTDDLDAALGAITQATQILVVGAGLSSAAALYFSHSLKVIGFDAHLALDGGLDLAVEASRLDSETVLVAIDQWRYVNSTVEAVHAAQQNDATVISITDSIVSPVAQAADYAFEVKTNGVAHSLSTTAVISLLNVFIAELGYRVPEQAMESLRRVDEAYRSNNLIFVD